MKNVSGDSDSSKVFFTYPQNGLNADGTPNFDKTKKVAVKFLVLNGQRVVDPYTGSHGKGGSNHNPLYSRLSSDGKIDEKSRFRNPGNYLVVPADYDPSEAVAFADRVNADIAGAPRWLPGAGQAAGAMVKTENFRPGGEQDLQRGKAWGVPAGETNPIFKDSASWNLGFVTEQIAMPNDDAEIGGGLLNQGEYAWHEIQSAVKRARDRLRGVRNTPGPAMQRPDGPFGMDEADAMNFEACVRSADMAGFHKAVIEHAAPGIGSVAPVPVTRNKNGQNQHGRQQAVLDSLHETIMTAWEDLPLRSMMRTALLPGSQGDPFLPARLNAPDPFGFSAQGATAQFPVAPGGQAGGCDLLVADGGDGLGTIGRQAGREPDHETGSPYDHGSVFDGFFVNSSDFGSALPSAAPMMRHMSHGGHGAVNGSSDDRSNRRFSAKPYNSDHASVLARKNWPGGSEPHRFDVPRDAAKRTAESNMVLARELAALLDHQGRLPPSGMTGFDPRLTPGWAGQKLPG